MEKKVKASNFLASGTKKYNWEQIVRNITFFKQTSLGCLIVKNGTFEQCDLTTEPDFLNKNIKNLQVKQQDIPLKSFQHAKICQKLLFKRLPVKRVARAIKNAESCHRNKMLNSKLVHFW